MATKYCDHGAYAAYTGTPTWGVPQDGDGLAKSASTASATASIVFSGVPSGTISVCGVTLSPTWGASADAAANGLATAINASTSSATTTGFRAGVQLRSAVYARGPASGAPAGTCEIMTRHGSALFNGQVAIAHALTNVNAGASALNFSGGVSGCWGYIGNVLNMWPQSMTNCAYGIWCTNPPFAGALAAGDVVMVRSGKTVTYPGSSANIFTFPALGSAQAYVTFVVDDGSVWAEDGPEPVLSLVMYGTSGGTRIGFDGLNTSYVRIKGKRYSGDVHSLRIANFGDGYTPIYDLHSPVWHEGAEFIGKTAYIQGGTSSLQSSAACRKFTACKLTWVTQNSAQRFIAHSGGGVIRAIFDDFIFDCGAATAPQVGILDMGATAGQSVWEFNSPRFVNFVLGSSLVANASGTATSTPHLAQIRNADYGNVTVLGPSQLGVTLPMGSPKQCVMQGVYSTSQIAGQDFFLDTPGGYVAWNSSRSFPTLNARLIDGLTPWSVQMVPATNAANIGPSSPLESPRFAKRNTLSSAIRTLTVNFGVEQSLSLNKGELSFLFEYVDTSGKVVTFSTLSEAGDAFDVGSGSWTNAVGAQFTYSENGTLYFDKKKIQVVTPTAVAEGGEIACTVRIHKAAATAVQMIFVCPEIEVQ